jgi:hypothetical protein
MTKITAKIRIKHIAHSSPRGELLLDNQWVADTTVELK